MSNGYQSIGLDTADYEAGIAKVNAGADSFAAKLLILEEALNKTNNENELFVLKVNEVSEAGTKYSSVISNASGVMKANTTTIVANMEAIERANAEKTRSIELSNLQATAISGDIDAIKAYKAALETPAKFNLTPLQQEREELKRVTAAVKDYEAAKIDLQTAIQRDQGNVVGNSLLQQGLSTSPSRTNAATVGELQAVQVAASKIQELIASGKSNAADVEKIIRDLDSETVRTFSDAELVIVRLYTNWKAAVAEVGASQTAVDAKFQADLDRMSAVESKRLDNASQRLTKMAQEQAALAAESIEFQRLNDLENTRLQIIKNEAQAISTRVLQEGINSNSRGYKSATDVEVNAAAASAGKLEEAIIRGGVSASRVLQIIKNIEGGVAEVYTNSERAIAGHYVSLQRNVENFGKTTDDAAKAAQGLGLSWQSVARLVQGNLIGQSVQYFRQQIQQSIEAAAEFEIKISEIRTISQDAPQSFDVWSASVENLSNKFGDKILDVAAAAYQTLSNQVAKGADTFRFMNEALQFGQVTLASAKDSVNLLSAAIKSFGLETTDAHRVASVLFNTVAQGRVRADELSNIFGRVGSVSHALGITIEETSAALATLTVRGIPANEAMTLLNNVMVHLLNPTGEMKKLFAELGVTSGEAMIQTFGLAGTLGKIQEKTRGSSGELATLFKDIRAIRGALDFTNQGLVDFQTNLAQISDRKKIDIADQISFESAGKQYELALNQLKNYFQHDFGVEILNLFQSLTTTTDEYGHAVNHLVPMVKGLSEALAFAGIAGGTYYIANSNLAASTVAAVKSGLVRVDTLVAETEATVLAANTSEAAAVAQDILSAKLIESGIATTTLNESLALMAKELIEVDSEALLLAEEVTALNSEVILLAEEVASLNVESIAAESIVAAGGLETLSVAFGVAAESATAATVAFLANPAVLVALAAAGIAYAIYSYNEGQKEIEDLIKTSNQTAIEDTDRRLKIQYANESVSTEARIALIKQYEQASLDSSRHINIEIANQLEDLDSRYKDLGETIKLQFKGVQDAISEAIGKNKHTSDEAGRLVADAKKQIEEINQGTTKRSFEIGVDVLAPDAQIKARIDRAKELQTKGYAEITKSSGDTGDLRVNQDVGLKEFEEAQAQLLKVTQQVTSARQEHDRLTKEIDAANQSINRAEITDQQRALIYQTRSLEEDYKVAQTRGNKAEEQAIQRELQAQKDKLASITHDTQHEKEAEHLADLEAQRAKFDAIIAASESVGDAAKISRDIEQDKVKALQEQLRLAQSIKDANDAEAQRNKSNAELLKSTFEQIEKAKVPTKNFANIDEANKYIEANFSAPLAKIKDLLNPELYQHLLEQQMEFASKTTLKFQQEDQKRRDEGLIQLNKQAEQALKDAQSKYEQANTAKEAGYDEIYHLITGKRQSDSPDVAKGGFYSAEINDDLIQEILTRLQSGESLTQKDHSNSLDKDISLKELLDQIRDSPANDALANQNFPKLVQQVEDLATKNQKLAEDQNKAYLENKKVKDSVAEAQAAGLLKDLTPTIQDNSKALRESIAAMIDIVHQSNELQAKINANTTTPTPSTSQPLPTYPLGPDGKPDYNYMPSLNVPMPSPPKVNAPIASVTSPVATTNIDKVQINVTKMPTPAELDNWARRGQWSSQRMGD